jgi:hypothetical protein
MANLSYLIFYKDAHSSSNISLFDFGLIISLLFLAALLKMLHHSVMVILINFLPSIICLVSSFVRTLTNIKYTSGKFRVLFLLEIINNPIYLMKIPKINLVQQLLITLLDDWLLFIPYNKLPQFPLQTEWYKFRVTCSSTSYCFFMISLNLFLDHCATQ